MGTYFDERYPALDAPKLMIKVIFGTDSIRHPLTGIGRYNYELAKCLKKSTEIEELLFLNGRHIASQLPSITETASVHSGLKEMVQKSRVASEIYRISAPWLKSRALKPYKDHIYHSPNFYLPPSVEHCVATFHDLSVFTWPQCHPKERVRYMEKELLLTIKRASVLITDSEYTRQELAAYFNYPLSRVFTARLASSGDFYPRSDSIVNRKISSLGFVADKYTLFTGSIEPRKNITTLLDAYERIPVQLRLEYPLVITGFKGWDSDVLHQRFEKANREGWLRYLGYTPSEMLPYLFSGAKAFIFPSLYEGFGLPVLEAMASGTPVVCSNSSSLPEVVGECALMNEPLDVEGFTRSIIKSIEDISWREQAITNGLLRAKLFSWEACAEETLNAYRQV